MGPPSERPRKSAVLEALRSAEAPLCVTDVAQRLGVHVNTVRYHLDTLVGEGSVERTSRSPSGPGRPPTVYAPRPGMDRGGVRGYLLLARILLSQLAAAGPGADESAGEAGRAWGGSLAGGPPAPSAPRPTAAEAAAGLTTLLDELGFAPEPYSAPEPVGDGTGGTDGTDGTTIRLRHCPFLELAEEYGPLVCRVHLGLMQGALATQHAPVTATRIDPFAESGVCLAHLERAGERGDGRKTERGKAPC